MTDLRQGQRVRFLSGPLGLVASPASARFEDEIAEEGSYGLYEGPHPVIEDWHIIKVEGKELYAPVHESQFELVR